MTGKDINIRQELAALYRLLDMYGMSDLANQCAGARSVENKDNYFIHPYGMFYNEIKASSILFPSNDCSIPFMNLLRYG